MLEMKIHLCQIVKMENNKIVFIKSLLLFICGKIVSNLKI